MEMEDRKYNIAVAPKEVVDTILTFDDDSK